MSSMISDSLEFKWDTDHLDCGTEERRISFQQVEQPSQTVYYSQPQQQKVVYGNNNKSDSVVKLIQFIVLLVFIGIVAYFICGGNPDVLVSYINSGVNKISEVLSNVHI